MCAFLVHFKDRNFYRKRPTWYTCICQLDNCTLVAPVPPLTHISFVILFKFVTILSTSHSKALTLSFSFSSISSRPAPSFSPTNAPSTDTLHHKPQAPSTSSLLLLTPAVFQLTSPSSSHLTNLFLTSHLSIIQSSNQTSFPSPPLS